VNIGREYEHGQRKRKLVLLGEWIPYTGYMPKNKWIVGQKTRYYFSPPEEVKNDSHSTQRSASRIDMLQVEEYRGRWYANLLWLGKEISTRAFTPFFPLSQLCSQSQSFVRQPTWILLGATRAAKNINAPRLTTNDGCHIALCCACIGNYLVACLSSCFFYYNINPSFFPSSTAVQFFWLEHDDWKEATWAYMVHCEVHCRIFRSVC
jgi:hypothetical protein